MQSFHTLLASTRALLELIITCWPGWGAGGGGVSAFASRSRHGALTKSFKVTKNMHELTIKCDLFFQFNICPGKLEARVVVSELFTAFACAVCVSKEELHKRHQATRYKCECTRVSGFAAKHPRQTPKHCFMIDFVFCCERCARVVEL